MVKLSNSPIELVVSKGSSSANNAQMFELVGRGVTHTENSSPKLSSIRRAHSSATACPLASAYCRGGKERRKREHRLQLT